MNASMTIVGLNQLGLSFAMALASQQSITRLGIDRRPEIAIQAEKKGQIDKAAFNLEKSVEQSCLVLLCVPPAELKETLALIAPALPENAVVLDTSPVAASAQQWAAELLPPGRFFLTFFPAVNPAYVLGDFDSQPRADLFKHGRTVICSSIDTPPEAINLAAGLAQWLEAPPFFCDSLEFQGWFAQTHDLPQLISAALLRLAASQPAWADLSRITGSSFTSAVRPLLEADAAAWQLNRDNLMRVLDQYIAALQDCRRMLAVAEPSRMETVVGDSLKLHQDWENKRRNSPEVTPAARQLASSAESIGSLLGISQLAALFKSKKQS